ncbi:WbqC-like protein family, partial [Candidatus Magnetomorum sp. HK-1]
LDILYNIITMIVTIHQPDFLPWLGFFDRWRKSDLYIVLDDVQFIRRGWQHRDKIKTAKGLKWLTISLIKKGNYLSEIRHIKIKTDIEWQNKHFKLIEGAYRKANNFLSVFNNITDIVIVHQCQHGGIYI